MNFSQKIIPVTLLCLASRKGGLLNLWIHWNLDEVHLKKILRRKKRKRIMTSLLTRLKIGPMRRIIIVGEAQQGKEIGTEGVIVIDTGTVTMIEIMIESMIGSGDEVEIERGTEIGRGTGGRIV